MDKNNIKLLKSYARKKKKYWDNFFNDTIDCLNEKLYNHYNVMTYRRGDKTKLKDHF